MDETERLEALKKAIDDAREEGYKEGEKSALKKMEFAKGMWKFKNPEEDPGYWIVPKHYTSSDGFYFSNLSPGSNLVYSGSGGGVYFGKK